MPSLSLTDFSIAIRNVLRQRRRAAFALVIIVGGVVSLILAGGFIDWVLESMRETTIRSQLGHVQVVRHGYFEKGIADPYAYLLPAEGPEIEKLRKTPGVTTVTPRLALNGLVSRGEATLSFVADGVDPNGEVELSKWVRIMEGQGLSAADPKGVILGEGLATSLGATIGDTLVLLANTPSGGINAIEVTIRGLFRSTVKAYDDTAIRLPLESARALTRVKGATSWVLLLEDTDQTDKIAEGLRAQLPSSDFDVHPWHELADFYNKTVVLFSQQVGVVKLLIGMIIVLSITNTLSMAVMERTGEVGTVMALGVRRSGVLTNFLLEGLVLGTLGGGLGIIAGALISQVVAMLGGITMPPAPGMSDVFFAQINVTPGIAADAFLLATATTLLASIFPAWKASRMNIVDALRHQR
jgi:putative ABC transport system permease protein